MSRFLALFVTHVVLLILASTSYSIVPGVAENFTWQSFRIAQSSMYGRPYISPYTLPVVLTYVCAYGLGVFLYTHVWWRKRNLLTAVAAAFCVAGFATFSGEATHWIYPVNRSLILSFPVVVLAIDAVVAVILISRRCSRCVPVHISESSAGW